MYLHQALHLTSHEVVAFVGGGGKTTAMFQLGHELAPTRRVLITTTTHLASTQLTHPYVTFDPATQTAADILPQLHALFTQHNPILLIHKIDRHKVLGVPPELIDALAPHVDLILVEADGSRQRPLKAPAPHEPVIPCSTTLVIPVIGLDILDQPLTSDTVHRPELVSLLSDTPLGAPITPETITKILTDGQGGLKDIPVRARVIPLLNQVRPETLPIARQLAQQLLYYPRLEAVMLGAVQNSHAPLMEWHSRVSAVILAAGGSSRFGTPKQLARWGQKMFLEHTVEIALAGGVTQVVVVLGAEVKFSPYLLRQYPVQVVINKRWAKGQSSSMQAGLMALLPHIRAALFMLIDLPQVTPTVLQSVIQRYQQTGAPLVWPEYEGQRGHPVLFDRALFPNLLQVQGDMGGRPVLQAYQAQAERVPVTEAGILYDIDRPEDLLNTPSPPKPY